MLRELDAGRHCGCRFRAIRGLMTHLAHAHGDGARALLNLLTASNQSPWCRSIFANRETAIKHTSAAAGPPLKTSPLSQYVLYELGRVSISCCEPSSGSNGKCAARRKAEFPTKQETPPAQTRHARRRTEEKPQAFKTAAVQDFWLETSESGAGHRDGLPERGEQEPRTVEQWRNVQ